MLGDSKVSAIVPTHDIATARRFYEDTLGAKIIDEVSDTAIRFECGSGSEFLLYRTEVTIPAEHTCMYFIVDDIDASVTDLRSRGVEFQHYDLEELGFEASADDAPGDGIILRMGELASAWFTDPEGNILSITQLPR